MTVAALAMLAIIAAGLWLALARLTGNAPLGRSAYCTYTLQAMAWRRGALSLGQDYPWLELAVYNGDYYVSFPPVPTIPVFLLTFLFGEAVPDNALVKVYGLIGLFAAFGALRACGWRRLTAGFAALCALFCGSVMALSVQGAVWYQAQMLALATTLLAVWLTARGKITPALFCYALSVGCRPFNVAYGPLLMFMWYRRQADSSLTGAVKGLGKGVALGLCVAAAMAAYNVVRFGDPLEFGTNYLPEFMRSAHGEFSLSHLKDNLNMFLFGLPLERTAEGWELRRFGFSVFIANPMLLCLAIRFFLDCARREMTPGKALCVLLFAAQLFLLLLHRTFGGFQFGARYAVDLAPYFILYGCLDEGARRLYPWEWAMGAAGVLLSLWGVALVHI